MRDRFPRARALTGLFAALFALGAQASAQADEPQRFLPPDLAPMAVLASIQPEGILQPPFLPALLSPGDLAKPHDFLNGQSLSACAKCHPPGRPSKVSNELCLAAGCHANDIGQHQANKKHFHGTDLVLKHSCGDCHTDHQESATPGFSMINDPNPKAKINGQQTPASAWGVAMQQANGSLKNWNHDLTTYKLIGGHKIDCDKCHKPASKRPKSTTRTFLGLSQACLACHENYHHFPAGDKYEDCLICHTFFTWKKFAPFDHDPPNTAFKLIGAHRVPTAGGKTECDKCHQKGKPFKPLAHATCEECHSMGVLVSRADGERAHGKTFTSHKCEFCHNEATWRTVKVTTDEHKKFAKFDAKGAHAALGCNHPQCHPGFKQTPPEEKKDESNCTNCHNNVHEDRWMKSIKDGCTKCHSDQRWKPVIVKAEDHSGWSNWDLLAGRSGERKENSRHLQLQCIRCHRSQVNGTDTGVPTEIPAKHDCIQCHLDIHEVTGRKQTYGKRCNDCHDTTGWAETGKQNNPHTDPKYFFQLVGGHAKPACEDCHKGMQASPQVMKIGDGKGACATPNCHASPHMGKLPDTCEKCHDINDWQPAPNFDHNRDSKYKLVGAHLQVACFKCHTNLGFRGTPTVCAQCHWDYHKGSWGPTDCSECHSTVRWQVEPGSLNFASLHNFGAIVLTGQHERLTCETCHSSSPRWQMNGMGGACYECHQDPHLGGRGPQCEVCHSQQAWVPTRFNHAMTGFPLYGVHRMVECRECHRGNVYSGLPRECVFCHYDDGVKFHGANLKGGINGQTSPALDCEHCHTPSVWQNSQSRPY